MARFSRIALGAGLLLAASAAHAALQPEAGVRNERPAALRDIEIEQKIDAQVPLDIVLRDEAGRERPLGEFLRGKPVILSLVYYECPMLCTLVLNGLTSALKTISFNAGNEFDIVTVSFDPTEGPALAAAKKEAYLDRYRRAGAEQGWHFLTGDAEQVERLAQSVGFGYRYDPAIEEFAHAAAIIVLTPEGRIARYFFGVEYPPRDLRLGLVEAARGRVGTVVDQIMLFCYRYDPATGKYTPIVMNIVRLGGLVTVIAIAAMILLLRRREGGSGPRQQGPSQESGQPLVPGRRSAMTAPSFAGATHSGQST